MAEATTQAAPVETGRLKYADPRDLPSYPSTGLPTHGAAAGVAATQGWNNQKPVEIWKPDKLSSASAAAVLAKDYKMAPQWAPVVDSAGHQAAVLAVGSASSAMKHHSSSTPRSHHDGWGNSAANQAYQTDRSQSAQKVGMKSPSIEGDRSLAAAKGAMGDLRRPRAISSPVTRGPELQLRSSAASNALNGAAIAHRASMQKSAAVGDAGAIPAATMARNMFTSRPMVKPEVDEQQANERLHQSAVDMAKKMYNRQQKMVEQAKERGEDPDKAYTTSPYMNLQDAAYKQAQERLAKLNDEHMQAREMQEYYGNIQAPPPRPRRRFTVSNRLTRRYSEEDVFDDREESAKIRQQMSMFSTKLSEVDKAKRQHDREALMAVAQRNVKARLQGMDEKMYHDTGNVKPALLSDWEATAHKEAQTRHETRTRTENKGKLHVGGGMYMEQEKVDAIAAKRMQPVLDDINDKAEKERDRVAMLEMEEEDRKLEQEIDRRFKALAKRIQEEDREEEKARREREKAERAEQKRLTKEGKRKSKHDSGTSGLGSQGIDGEGQRHKPGAGAIRDEQIQREEAPQAAEPDEPQPALASRTVPEPEQGATADVVEGEERQATEDSPSHRSGVRVWIKNRFSRGRSFSEPGERTQETENSEKTERRERQRSLLGGGNILRKTHQRNPSQTSLEHRSSSMRDVALAGTAGEGHEAEANGPSAPRDSRGLGPMSAQNDEAETRRTKDGGGGPDIEPPRPIRDFEPRSSISPSRDSRFREEM